MQLADSVLVNPEGSPPEVLTRFSPSGWSDASYEIKDEADDVEMADDDSEGEFEELPDDSDDDDGKGRSGRRRCAPASCCDVGLQSHAAAVSIGHTRMQ